jgi:hypothetical protein
MVTFSCKKEKEEEELEVNNETTTAQDNAISQNMFDDVKKVVEETANDEGNTSKAGYFFGTCAAVTIVPAWIDSTTWPKTMTIDFGPTNCTGNDGLNRRGKIIVTLTDRYRNAGSKLIVNPQNYFVNDHQIEGTKTLTNNGRNGSNNLTFTVQVTNGKITFPTGGYTTWNSTRTNEWIAGDTTSWFTHGLSGLCDDVYLITGSANGINRLGLAYTVNITSPLRKEICCRWIVSGMLDIIPSGLPTRSVNYDPGNTGNCDAIASVTIAGNTFTIIIN